MRDHDLPLIGPQSINSRLTYAKLLMTRWLRHDDYVTMMPMRMTAEQRGVINVSREDRFTKNQENKQESKLDV